MPLSRVDPHVAVRLKVLVDPLQDLVISRVLVEERLALVERGGALLKVLECLLDVLDHRDDLGDPAEIGVLAELGHALCELRDGEVELLLLLLHFLVEELAVVLHHLVALLLLQLEAQRPVEGLPARREILLRCLKLQFLEHLVMLGHLVDVRLQLLRGSLDGRDELGDLGELLNVLGLLLQLAEHLVELGHHLRRHGARSLADELHDQFTRAVELVEDGCLERLGVHEVRADEHPVGQLRLELRLVRALSRHLVFKLGERRRLFLGLLKRAYVRRLVALQQLLMSTHRIEELGEGDNRVLGLRDEPVTQVTHLVLSRADRRERVQRERHGDRLIKQVDLPHVSDGADGVVEQLRDDGDEERGRVGVVEHAAVGLDFEHEERQVRQVVGLQQYAPPSKVLGEEGAVGTHRILAHVTDRVGHAQVDRAHQPEGARVRARQLDEVGLLDRA